MEAETPRISQVGVHRRKFMNRVRSITSVQRNSSNRAIAGTWLLVASCVVLTSGCSAQGGVTPAPDTISGTGGNSSGAQGGSTNAGNQGGNSNVSVGGGTAVATGGSVNAATGGSVNNPATGGAANNHTGGSVNNPATGGAGNDTGGAGNDTGGVGNDTGGAGNDETGGAGNDETGGAGNDATGGSTSVVECLNSGSGSGYCTDTGCVPECQYGDKTDPDSSGATDGWGWELQANCVVASGTVASASASRCEPAARTDLPPAGDGREFKDETGTLSECMPQCVYGDKTDADSSGATDGYGWELQANCVVADSVADAKGIPCVPATRTDLPTPGDGYEYVNSDGTMSACHPKCTHGTLTMDTSNGTNSGWGWELQATCIVPDSVASMQGIPCVPPTRTDLPTPGNGYQFLKSDGTPDGGCRPPCPSSVTGDTNGWGWDDTAKVSCIVAGSIAAAQGMPCVP
jgi:hypothetical protein